MTNIKSLIFEQVDLDEGDLEEIANYPENFSIETLKSLPSFNKKVKYAQEHLGKVGAGSARIVFVADNDTVIKLAKNPKGLAQNDLEIDVGRIDQGRITTIIKDFDKDSLWVEMERARKAKKSDFPKLIGFGFDEFMESLYSMSTKLHGSSTLLGNVEIDPEMKENESFQAIVDLMADYDMTSADITRISSWGVVVRNGQEKLVIVDYGLNRDVWKQFYQRPGRY
jgi:hypothetical protein